MEGDLVASVPYLQRVLRSPGKTPVVARQLTSPSAARRMDVAGDEAMALRLEETLIVPEKGRLL